MESPQLRRFDPLVEEPRLQIPDPSIQAFPFLWMAFRIIFIICSATSSSSSYSSFSCPHLLEDQSLVSVLDASMAERDRTRSVYADSERKPFECIQTYQEYLSRNVSSSLYLLLSKSCFMNVRRMLLSNAVRTTSDETSAGERCVTRHVFVTL